MKQRKKLKLWNKILPIIAAILFLACLGFYIYISNYYHASSSALKALNEPQSNITVEVQDNSRIIFQPEAPTAGLIFYPGGKVQYEAYAPLMEACAQREMCIRDRIYFVNQIVEYIVHNGMMKDFSVLQEPPFTDRGSVVEIFTDMNVWLGIRKVIDTINANAAA